MLRIREAANLGEEKIRSDAYTFVLEWPVYLEDPFYWRAGLVSGSFLEIGIDYKTGRMKSVGLVVAKQVSSWPSSRASVTSAGLPKQNGSPVFYVEDEWDSGLDMVLTFDASEDVWVRVGEHRIALDFGDYERVASYIHNGRVSFGVDQNGLLYTIEVGNLTDEEMSNLRQHLRFLSS